MFFPWKLSFYSAAGSFLLDLQFLHWKLRTKMSTNPSSSIGGYKDLYPWASSELLDECSSLLSTRALREHVGEECSYDRRAFAKRHDDDIVVLPRTLGEPV